MDWSLICRILRNVSEQLKEFPDRSIRFPELEGVSFGELCRYVRHCHELGYLQVGFADGGPIHIRHMTAHGYKAMEDICHKRFGSLYANL